MTTKKAPLSDWLKAHLEKTGVIDSDGIGRRARVRTCRGCSNTVLIGLDGDTCALVVEADPVPLSPLGEALALIEGRRTVTLSREGGRYVLGIRYDLMIEAHAAGTQLNTDILRSHRCGTDVPTGPLETPSMHPSARAVSLPANSPAPF
jgi:hypothetical protein